MGAHVLKVYADVLCRRRSYRSSHGADMQASTRHSQATCTDWFAMSKQNSQSDAGCSALSRGRRLFRRMNAAHMLSI